VREVALGESPADDRRRRIDCRADLDIWLAHLKWLTHDDVIELAVDDLTDGRPLWAERDSLFASLRNMHTNAVTALRAHLEGPWRLRVSVRVDRPIAGDDVPEYVVISVADTGCGIPAAQQPLIFRRRIADSASGHGLGTQIVGRTMDEHAGLIRFATRPGRGTLVELWLPHLNLTDGDLKDGVLRSADLLTYQRLRERLGPVERLPDDRLLSPGEAS
jgi:signal transduction histidine kinase